MIKRVWHYRILISLPATVVLLSSAVRAATPEQVDAAIGRGKDWLYTQYANGTFEAVPSLPPDADLLKMPASMKGGQWGGATALSVYALLAAGESAQSEKVAAAIKFLNTADIKGVYALGVKSQLYYFLPPTGDIHRSAQNDANKFLSAVSRDPKNAGLYHYLIGEKFVSFDHSVSQYGVLGMRACEDAEAEVPLQYWAGVEKAWIRDQDSGGGWCYQKTPENYPICASMTAAGVATLFITQDYLHADAGVRCTGNITNPHIDLGLKWIVDNFDRVFTDKTAYGPYYALYGLQRIGVASGLKYFGSNDWYRVGSDYLVSHQAKNGSWYSLPTTCFALLFLSRGHAPVVINKLQYESGAKVGNWNERPRDAANITRFISKATERDLNWQIVDLHVPTYELHDAPILMISGNQALNLLPEDEKKLRTFCQEGGIILANADGASPGFGASFRKLATRLFPDYEMRKLPVDSVILKNQQYPASKWKTPISVQSVSNGVREMMVLIPEGDPGKWWQLNDTARVSAFQFADDLFLYAVDRQNLLEKGKTYLVLPDSAVTPTRTLRIARMQYAGNWDPEPAGWPRVAAILHNSANIQLEAEVIKLGENKLGNGHGPGITVAHLTGTGRLQLTAIQQKEIHEFTAGGGTLIVDAAGGNAEFADSAKQQLIAIFGPDTESQLKAPLPMAAPLYHLPGGVIDKFGYRQYARGMLGTLRGPQLRAITVENRPAVFFSQLDLSAGLVGQQVDGILGYDPDTSAAIVRNLVALGLGKNASIQPTPKAKPGA